MVVQSIPVVESEAVPASAAAQTLRKTRTAGGGGISGAGLGPITCHDNLQLSIDAGDVPNTKKTPLPVKSFRDDVQRKTALHKVMGPHPDEKAPVKRPDQSERSNETVEPNFDGQALGMADDSTDDMLNPSDDQYTKEEVNYRYSGDSVQSCGSCVHFQFPGSCEIVAGLIRPVDVCQEFEAADQSEPSGVFHQPDAPDEESDADTVPSEIVVEAEVSPPGWSGTVKAMKKHPKISNPFALAYWMKDRGDTPHYKPEKKETGTAASPLVTGGPGSGRHADSVARSTNAPDTAVTMHIRDQKKNLPLCGRRGEHAAVAPGMPTPEQLNKVSCPGCLNKYAGRMARSSEEGGVGSGRHKFAPEQPQSAEDKQIDRFTKREKPAERAARIASKKVDPATARAVGKYFAQAEVLEVREYSPDQARDHGRWTSGGGSKGAGGDKAGLRQGTFKQNFPGHGGKPLNKGAQKAKDLADARRAGQQKTAPPTPASPSSTLNKGAQRAQMVGRARADVHAAKVDQATNDRIVANLRQMGFIKNAEVESVAVG